MHVLALHMGQGLACEQTWRKLAVSACSWLLMHCPAVLQVLLPCWAANPTAVTLELYMQPYPSNSSSSSSRALQPAVCFAKMELPLSKLAQQQSGRACLIRDLQLTAALPRAVKGGKGSTTCSAALEVVQWEVDAYLGHLQQLAAAAQAAAKAAAAQAAAAASTALGELGVDRQWCQW